MYMEAFFTADNIQFVKIANTENHSEFNSFTENLWTSQMQRFV